MTECKILLLYTHVILDVLAKKKGITPQRVIPFPT